MTDTQPTLPNATVTGSFELLARVASGTVMAGVMVGALVLGGIAFAVVTAACAIAALREWHRLINGLKLAREMIPTSLGVAAAALLVQPPMRLDLALLAIALGAVFAAASAALRRPAALWPIPCHAFGAFYIGFTVLALTLLRGEPLGALYVGGLFVAVWTADTGALITGRLIGGPKLVPTLSPNKTWSGFVGGTLAAALAEALYVSLFSGSVTKGLIFGIFLALMSHAGDLFESWVKRVFRAKNTGSLIPGHGGMLDRIDSLLFAAPAYAALIYAGITPFSRIESVIDLDLKPVIGRSLTVLGATGSVGTSTLDVVRFARGHYGPEAFPLIALTAQSNVAKLAELSRELKPKLAVVSDESRHGELKAALSGTGIETGGGRQAVLDAASRASDMVMSAIVGCAGLEPTYAALGRGAIVALANKECVVAAGDVFRKAAADSRGVVIPVDSEHNAAFQLLDFKEAHAIEMVTLTASGGPFRTWSLERMASATPEQAVSHPNWAMGAKISVDSATLMNKGLELIEAHILFGLPPEKLDVIVHAQSAVHCLVAYADGSVLAHMSAPDMRTPIAHALGWPRRIASPSKRLDFSEFRQMTFEKPDLGRFPCLGLANACLQTGGGTPTILNAANEVAVGEFLGRQIGFLDIARTVERTLNVFARETNGRAPAVLAEVLELDGLARVRAKEACGVLAA